LNWRRDALGLALVALDSFALAAAVGCAFILNSTAREAPPPGIFLAVLFAAYATTRLLPELTTLTLRATRGTAAAIAVIVILVAAWNQYGHGVAFWDPSWLGTFLYRLRGMLNPLASEPAEALAVVAFGLAWWRGTSLALGPNTYERVLRALRLGVVAYALNLALAGMVREETPVGNTVVPYVAVGMLVLALARQTRWQEERHGAVRPAWLAIAVTTVLGLVGSAAVLALLFGTELFGLLLDLASALGLLVAAILYPLLLGLGYVAEFLVNFLRERARFNPLQVVDSIARNVPTPTPGAEPTPAPGPLVPPVVGEALNWLVLAALLGAGIFGLAWALRRGERAAREEDEGEREALGTAATLRRDLRGLLRWPRRAGRRRPEELSSVQALYRRLLARASELGQPRRAAETPFEYAPRADVVLPPAAVHEITEAYVRVRYGEEALGEEDLEALKRLWEG
jgi:hypothetical protein